MKSILFSSLILLTTIATAEEPAKKSEVPVEPVVKVTPGKAVTEFNSEEGFKMSEGAMKSFNVKFEKIESHSPWILNKDALVKFKFSSGVYRRYDGWITMVLVKVQKEVGGRVHISSDDLEAGDEVAVSGASFLRVTEADLRSDTVDSCSH